MRYFVPFVASLACACAIIAGTFAAASVAFGASPTVPPAVTFAAHTGPAIPLPCGEDQPCWTWSTMGNHRRGVLTVHGIRVVGPCAFRRMWMRGEALVWDAEHRTSSRADDPMRGDWHAIVHGCEVRPRA